MSAGLDRVVSAALALVPTLPPKRRVAAADPCGSCATCLVRTACLPQGSAQSPDALEGLGYGRKRVKRDELLCHMGAPVESLYAVRSGFFESRSAVEDGREQVTGFHMPGDIVGMDAIATGKHGASVVALEDAEVCVIPFARLGQPEVQRHVQKAMTHELSRARGMLLSLGTLSAEERVAAFLLGFSRRMQALGYACDEFQLRMSRGDIGSYLGMSIETACRILMRFDREGVIALKQRRVRILDMPALAARAASTRQATLHPHHRRLA